MSCIGFFFVCTKTRKLQDTLEIKKDSQIESLSNERYVRNFWKQSRYEYPRARGWIRTNDDNRFCRPTASTTHPHVHFNKKDSQF